MIERSSNFINFDTAKLAYEKGVKKFSRFIYPAKKIESYQEDRCKIFEKGKLYEYIFEKKEDYYYAYTIQELTDWFIKMGVDLSVPDLGSSHNVFLNAFKTLGR